MKFGTDERAVDEELKYRGYRLQVHPYQNGVQIQIFEPGATVPERDIVTGPKDKAIVEAKATIDRLYVLTPKH